MKKIFLALPFFLIYNANCIAQQCGNCKHKPKVASYDLDIQVPQPKLQGQQTVGWLEWTRLFEIIGKINFALKQNTGNCIIFTQPNDARLSSESFTTKDGIEVPPLKEESDQLKVGLYYTNLPPKGDVSRFGDYITTGSVKLQGNAFVMHIEIQTACERKVVAQATIPFDSLRNSQMTANVANQAVAQLSPLSEKIKKFELEKRQISKSLSLYKMEGDPIKITPSKNTLKAGESTEFTIELKDCDGVPLQGREILFTETEFEGLKVFGTIGGTVSPAKVVTDPNGKATALFTLKAGAKKAIINAHSAGNDVKGCTSMFTGDAVINIRGTWSGTITFLQRTTGKSAGQYSDDIYKEYDLLREHRMEATFSNGQGTGRQSTLNNERKLRRERISGTNIHENESKEYSITEGTGTSVLSISIDQEQKTYSIEVTIPESKGQRKVTYSCKGCNNSPPTPENSEIWQEASGIRVDDQPLGNNPNVITGEIREETKSEDGITEYVTLYKWSFTLH